MTTYISGVYSSCETVKNLRELSQPLKKTFPKVLKESSKNQILDFFGVYFFGKNFPLILSGIKKK